jgi:hypothetical protein
MSVQSEIIKKYLKKEITKEIAKEALFTDAYYKHTSPRFYRRLHEHQEREEKAKSAANEHSFPDMTSEFQSDGSPTLEDLLLPSRGYYRRSLKNRPSLKEKRADEEMTPAYHSELDYGRDHKMCPLLIAVALQTFLFSESQLRKLHVS